MTLPRFRAWHKELKIMMGVKALYFASRDYPVDQQKQGDCTQILAYATGKVDAAFYPQAHLELMQCTGLQDKNVKKIFVGDIIILDDRFQDKYWIEGHKGSWVINYKSKYSEKTIRRLYDFTDRLEIIGNIYESPELLEIK